MLKSLIRIPEMALNKKAEEEIISCNDFTLDYHLKLTKKDAALLVAARSTALKEQGRVEFGGGIVKKIIEKFCDSPFIMQQNYTFVISELIDIFYYYKNETLDLIGDDELISLMKKYFDENCFGSLDLLKGRDLDKLAHNIKFNVKDYADISPRKKEGELDEK